MTEQKKKPISQKEAAEVVGGREGDGCPCNDRCGHSQCGCRCSVHCLCNGHTHV